MNCPRCALELVPAQVSGVAVSRCTRCGGTWLDEEGFREAQDRADPEHDWLHLEIWREHERFAARTSELACPACARALVRMRYGETQVEIDHCPTCAGIWLEERDLEAIVRALEDEAAAMPAQELVAAALREAAEIARGPGRIASDWQHFGHLLRLLELRVLTDHPGLRQMLLNVQQGTPFG